MALAIRVNDLKIQMTDSIFKSNNYNYITLKGEYVRTCHTFTTEDTYKIYLDTLNYIIRDNKLNGMYIIGFTPFIEYKFFK